MKENLQREKMLRKISLAKEKYRDT